MGVMDFTKETEGLVTREASFDVKEVRFRCWVAIYIVGISLYYVRAAGRSTYNIGPFDVRNRRGEILETRGS